MWCTLHTIYYMFIGTGSHYRNGRKCSKEIISIMWCIYMNMAIVLCMNLGAYVGKPTSLLSHHFSVALLLSHAVTQIICWKDYRLETYINPSWKSLLHISVIDASIWTPATKKQKSFQAAIRYSAELLKSYLSVILPGFPATCCQTILNSKSTTQTSWRLKMNWTHRVIYNK